MELNARRRMRASQALSTMSMDTFASGGRSGKKPSILRKHAKSKWLGWREYMLLFIEASLALTKYVIRYRATAASHTDQGSRTTIRQNQITLLYYGGFGAPVSLIIGCFTSCISLYTLSLLSMVLHFATAAMVMSEHVILQNLDDGENPYEEFMLHVCQVAFILIKSSDFTRLAYALEGMHDRTESTTCQFIFFQFMCGSYAMYGGIFVNLFDALIRFYNIDLILVAFAISGFSLFLFWSFLQPEERNDRPISCEVIGCLSLAIYYKIFRIKKRGVPKGFLERTGGTFDGTALLNTKMFTRYSVSLSLSCLGIAFVIMHPQGLFWNFEEIKSEAITKFIGIQQLARSAFCAGMILANFVLWPLLKIILRFKTKLVMPKFLTGYFLAAISMYYGGLVIKLSDRPFEHSLGLCFFRVFNTRDDPVQINHMETTVADANNILVPPHTGITMSYQSAREGLLPTTFLFNGTTGTNISMFMSITPGEVDGYVILDPPMVVKIRGHLPVREGPPGTNKGSQPKIFFFNTAKTLSGATIVIKYTQRSESLAEVKMVPGSVKTIALRPDTYDFIIPKADLTTTMVLKEGGVYGLLSYSARTIRRVAIDTVVNPNTRSLWLLLSHYFILGHACGLSYPSLMAALYVGSPRGLVSLMFAIVAALEGIALWIIYIGFQTWHRYVSTKVIHAYASAVAADCIFCVFFYSKAYKGLKESKPQKNIIN